MWPEVEQQMFKSVLPFQFGINWKRVGGGGGRRYLLILIRIIIQQEFFVLIIRFSV
jgi:hypothetical protein